MNKLFIIGNGFDLAHKVPTNYTNFIYWLIDRANKDHNNGNKHYLYEEVLQILSAPGTYTANITCKLDFQKAKDEGLLIKVESLFIKDLLVDVIEKNWVDIERRYYHYVKKLFLNHSKNIFGDDKKQVSDIKKLNSRMEFLKASLTRYLCEISYGDFLSVKEIDDHIQTERNDVLFDQGESILFLNFNYTPTFKKYIRYVNDISKESICHIHGNLEELEKHPVIFGYGDEMDKFYSEIEGLDINEYTKNFKSFGYFFNDSYSKLSSFISTKEYDVCIMGHSCGLSDRVLLSNIFDNSNCRRIKIFYHARQDGSNDYFEKTQEISRHFKPENKHIMRNPLCI